MRAFVIIRSTIRGRPAMRGTFFTTEDAESMEEE